MARAAVASSAIVLEVLNQHNYNDWSSRVQTYLLAEELWNVVNEEESHSDEAWKTKDAKALHAIKISCGTEMFSFIREAETANKAWKVLERKIKSSYKKPLHKNGDENNEIPELFFDHVEKSDWENAKKCFDTAEIPKTVLHQAVSQKRVKAVKELANSEYLETHVGNGRTPLCCTIIESEDDGEDWVTMASYMVEKNSDILGIEISSKKRIPVVLACDWSKYAMARYLYSRTPRHHLAEENRERGAHLICTCIRDMKGLDIARDLLESDPQLAVACNKYNDYPMLILAGTRNAFLSGQRLTFWQKLIYRVIHTQPVDFNIRDSWIDVPQSKEDQGNQRGVFFSVKSFCRRVIKGVLKHFGISHIYEMKSTHDQVNKILCCMGKMTKNMNEAQQNVVRDSVFKAIEHGHVEFITHMCKANEALVDIHDEKDKNIFQYAIECRQEEIYNLIYGLEEKKTKKIGYNVAKLNTNMLHSVANLSPITRFNHIQDASLQMQRELQWFEEVKNIVPIKMHEYINYSDGLTAHELFIKNHKKLKKEAEISMKGTATACTTVGALIVTIMFAVAFTVPGGTTGNTGLPMFMHKKLFRVFIVSDTISLASSSTSVITFLGILTSRYAEFDFLKSLPRKMMVGLFTLFISIAAMMTAFSCALTIMLDGEACIIIPIIVFASVPVISFLWLLFPLLVEIWMSTYGRGIFDRSVKPWLLLDTHKNASE